MDKKQLQEAARVAEGLKQRQGQVNAVIQAYIQTAINPVQEKNAMQLVELLNGKLREVEIANLSASKFQDISNLHARCTEAIESRLQLLGAKWDAVKPVIEKFLKEYSLEE